MAYVKHDIRLTDMDALCTKLQQWFYPGDPNSWLSVSYTEKSDRFNIWFSANGQEPDSPYVYSPDSCYMGRLNSNGKFYINAKYGHSTVGTEDYDISRAGPAGGDYYHDFYYNDSGVTLASDYSTWWFDAVYISDNFVAFTMDHANSATDRSLKNIPLVIAKTTYGDVAYIPDSSLATSTYDNTTSKDVIAINYDTEILCTVPTQDNNYTAGGRLSNMTVLSPIACNDNKNRMLLDVYAVSAKEHRSFCDILEIGGHHYLTNGKVACKLD